MSYTRLLCVFFIMFYLSAKAQKDVYSVAELTDVRVYFNGADMHHKVKVKVPKGSSQIVISNLAGSLLQNTIQIGSDKDVVILANTFTDDYSSSPDKALTGNSVLDSIHTLKKELEYNAITSSSLENALDLLNANKVMPSGSENFSLQLDKLLDFYTSKYTSLSVQIQQTQAQREKLQFLLDNLEAKRSSSGEVGSNYGKGKILLQVESLKDQEVNLDLRYFTTNASWFASYELNVPKINDSINLIYKAQVNQNSGLDWNKVRLSLTSGYANTDNVLPELSTWYIDYSKPVVINNSDQRLSLVSSSARLQSSARPKAMFAGPEVQVNTSGLNISFEIDALYNIASDTKRHQVILDRFSLEADYQYFSVVKVDPSAYLVAKIKGYEDLNLLPGSASIMLEGIYVGKTQIDTENTDNELVLNLGKDPRVQVSRKLITDKTSSKVLSSRKSESIAYQILVKNSQSVDIKLIIEDQVPVSVDSDIQVDVDQKSNGVLDKVTGILTWDLNIGANQSKVLDFGYTIKYNKDKQILNK